MVGSAYVPKDIPTGPDALNEPHELSYSVGILPSDAKHVSRDSEIETTGQETFKNGEKFSLRFSANADGYIYAFNEGLNSKGELDFSLLYPVPDTNKGSARMIANQPLEAPGRFEGRPGTEVIWLIWTKYKNAVLENAKQSATRSYGVVKDENTYKSLIDFIDGLREKGGDSFVDSSVKKVVVRGSGDAVLRRIELQHR